MENICGWQRAGNARLGCGHKERQMPRFDSRSFGTKLPGHMTWIFSANTRWKAFAAKKTVTPFVESVKNTQRSISDDSGSSRYRYTVASQRSITQFTDDRNPLFIQFPVF